MHHKQLCGLVWWFISFQFEEEYELNSDGENVIWTLALLIC